MDHYQLLGIKRTASKDEVKKAYHRQALKYHPDKNKASDAESKFKSLNEAYKVLKDEQKRELYDRFELTQTRAKASSSSRSHDHQRRDDRFFKGASEALSEEQKYRQELDRIRQYNSDLLDEANAKLRRPQGWKFSSERTKRGPAGRVFVGEILPNESDDDYEKIVLDRLRQLAS